MLGKTTLATLLITAFIVLAPSRLLADSVSIQPVTTNVSPGDSFTLNINISGATDLYGFQFDLGFDASVLSATGITEGAFLPTGGLTFFLPGTVDNVGGSITFNADTLLGPGPGVAGNGVLATVGFTAIGSGTSTVNLSNLSFLDSKGDIIDTVGANGTVNVRAASPTPEPPTLYLLGIGLFGLLCWTKLRRAQSEAA